MDTISHFLLENDMTVYLVIFDKSAYRISGKLFANIAEYIDDCYAESHTDSRRRLSSVDFQEEPGALLAMSAFVQEKSLVEMVEQLDESFSEMLLRKIDESGMTDAQCYKKVNIDRKLFSKIRSDKLYKPSELTVLASPLLWSCHWRRQRIC